MNVFHLKGHTQNQPILNKIHPDILTTEPLSRCSEYHEPGSSISGELGASDVAPAVGPYLMEMGALLGEEVSLN